MRRLALFLKPFACGEASATPHYAAGTAVPHAATRILVGLLLTALVALPAHADKATSVVPAPGTPATLKLGFAPFENQREVLKKAGPIVKALGKSLGCKVQPFVAGDYPGVVEAMRGGKLDVAFFSPAALIMAERVAGAKVILKSIYHGRAHYFSAIITRSDSPYKKLSDLKGKNFAFVDPGSTTGGVYPKLMLMNAGLEPSRDLGKVIYAGGHDAAILAVYNRKVDAAATFANDDQGEDVPWKHILKADAGQVRVLAYSKPIPNGAVAVSKKLTPQLVERIKRAFLDLGTTPDGREMLSHMYLIEKFAPAQSSDYDPVREAFTKVGLSLK